MNERIVAMQQLRYHAVEAKRAIETVLDIMGWPADPVLNNALARLNELKEQAS